MSDKTLRLGRQEQDGAPRDEGGRNQRVVLMAGSLGAVALAAAGMLLLSGGGDGDEQAVLAAVQAPPRSAQLAVAPSPSPVAASPVSVAPPGRARDPFRALIVAPTDTNAVTQGDTTGAPAAAGEPVPALPGGVPAPVVVPEPQQLPDPVVEPVLEGPVLGPVPGPAPVPALPSSAPSASPLTTSVTLSRVLGTGDTTRAEFLLGAARVTASIGEQLGTSQVRLLSLQQEPESNRWTAVLKDGAGEPFDALIGVAVRLG